MQFNNAGKEGAMVLTSTCGPLTKLLLLPTTTTGGPLAEVLLLLLLLLVPCKAATSTAILLQLPL